VGARWGTIDKTQCSSNGPKNGWKGVVEYAKEGGFYGTDSSRGRRRGRGEEGKRHHGGTNEDCVQWVREEGEGGLRGYTHLDPHEGDHCKDHYFLFS